MALITERVPESWEQLEELVTAILNECGMMARRKVSLALPRGSVDVDVLAEETSDRIVQRIICECKNWRTNIPREVVHAFRTVMQETGAHRGYIISKVGFQPGAVEAARATNIELVTFIGFQNIYFDKWINKRIWRLEHEIGNFNTYYEPLGPPGYSLLSNEEERRAYDEVWNKYLFAGLMLQPFSPYLRMMGTYPFPELPFDISKFQEKHVRVPEDVRTATAYREFLKLLETYARRGLTELRAVNPVTREKMSESVVRED